MDTPRGDWTMATVSLVIGIVKDLTLTIGALVAMSVAIKGLSAWRRQLRGNTNHDLARRLLLSASKLRDAVITVRMPGITPDEAAVALKEVGQSLDGLDERRSLQAQLRAVYAVRWRGVQEAQRELKINAMEAEVLWGKQVEQAHRAIRDSVHKLWAAITLDREFAERGVQEEQGPIMARKAILHPMTDRAEEDQFMVQLDAAIERLDAIARPYLAEVHA